MPSKRGLVSPCSSTTTTTAHSPSPTTTGTNTTPTTQAAIMDKTRRRSLKTLLHIPSTSRAPTHTPISSTGGVGSIPADIVREIVDLLSPSDILSFSLASKYLRELLLPALYDTVILKSSRACRSALPMLQTRPDICAYIKKLAVRPNYYLSWPRPDEFLEEDWVVDQVIHISHQLTLVNTFDWDGLELPRDELWEVLQKNCPTLKSIFTNVGTHPLNPHSTLFDFKNLTSFSLIVRHGLPGTDLFPPLEPLPPRLWDMLINKCPDLEELAICSFSSLARVLDFERVVEGRWKKLKMVTLGSFGYLSDFRVGPLGDDDEASDDDDDDDDDTNDDDDDDDDNTRRRRSDPSKSLGKFLLAHPTLTYIRLLWNFKRWMSPPTISIPHLIPATDAVSSPSTASAAQIPFSIPVLPNLTTFIGIYQQLAQLPQSTLENIETVDLTCEPVYESRVAVVCDVLKRAKGLKVLDVWMHVLEGAGATGAEDGANGNGGAQGESFGEIMRSCPGLTDFHFMCTTAFTVKPLKLLLTHLPLLPHLKHFSLTKGHQYIDESMLSTAMRIVKAKPGLKQVCIRWARERCPNHLKQEGVYDVIREVPEEVRRMNGAGVTSKGPTSGLASPASASTSAASSSKIQPQPRRQPSATFASGSSLAYPSLESPISTKPTHISNSGTTLNSNSTVTMTPPLDSSSSLPTQTLSTTGSDLDPSTLPTHLFITERGIPLIGSPFLRKYRYKIDREKVWPGVFAVTDHAASFLAGDMVSSPKSGFASPSGMDRVEEKGKAREDPSSTERDSRLRRGRKGSLWNLRGKGKRLSLGGTELREGEDDEHEGGGVGVVDPYDHGESDPDATMKGKRRSMTMPNVFINTNLHHHSSNDNAGPSSSNVGTPISPASPTDGSGSARPRRGLARMRTFPLNFSLFGSGSSSRRDSTAGTTTLISEVEEHRATHHTHTQTDSHIHTPTHVHRSGYRSVAFVDEPEDLPRYMNADRPETDEELVEVMRDASGLRASMARLDVSMGDKRASMTRDWEGGYVMGPASGPGPGAGSEFVNGPGVSGRSAM